MMNWHIFSSTSGDKTSLQPTRMILLDKQHSLITQIKTNL